MSETPFIKFYPSDFLGGTSGLSPAERGTYITLLCLIYEANGPIPRDDTRLSRRCGAPKAAFSKMLASLIDEGKITETDGMLSNERAEKSLMDRANRTQNATHAAHSRWSAQTEKTQKKQGVDNAGAMPGQCVADASQKPELEVKDTDVSFNARKPAKRKSRIGEDAEITDGMLKAASRRNLSQQESEAQFQRFKNNALAKGLTYVDWDRAFVTWLDSPFFKPITAIQGGQYGNGNHDTDRLQRTIAAAARGTSGKDWG